MSVAVPFPPRYWWLKRLGLLGAVLLVGFICAWGVLMYRASRDWNRIIADLHSQGRPAVPEDLNPTGPAIPDNENYASYLHQAAAAIHPDEQGPSASNSIFPDYFLDSKEWRELAEKALPLNQKTLELVSQSRGKTKIDWGERYGEAKPVAALKSFNMQRSLANLLGDMAVLKHLQGDDVAALEYLRDVLHQSRAIARNGPLLNQLVSIGIRALACSRLAMISPGLTMSDAERGLTSPARRATREQIRELLADLETSADPAVFVDGMEIERIYSLDMRSASYKHLTLLRPIFIRESINDVRDCEVVKKAGGQTMYFTAITKLAPIPLAMGTSGTFTRPNIDRCIQTDFRVRVLCMLSRTTLAVQLWRLDNPNQWPKSLDELVPKYLPSVPIDLYSKTNSMISYGIFENGHRPMVWLASETGTAYPDPTPLPTSPIYGWETKTRSPMHDLSRYVPTTQPSTQSAK